MNHYDYIILGGGAAGLCCAMELSKYKKSVLILEKNSKNSDDRTWSFWEKGEGQFDSILHKSWDHINYYGNINKENIPLDGYTYKMIRSSSFYRLAKEKIAKNSRIDYLQEYVQSLNETGEQAEVYTTGGKYSADIILDSISRPQIDKTAHYYVDQHFGGWFIESGSDVFQENTATLMDFRIDQQGETRFFYVLPFNKREALIEIAIFSNDVLDMEEYDREIKSYIDKYLQIDSYSIVEKEKGVIPMTSYPFHQHNTPRIIRIGTAGGWVKPSSGYAFKRITERSSMLIQQLENNEKLHVHSSGFYQWMDKIMLKAIENKYVSGKEVFDSLFSKSSPAAVFRFLDEENTFLEDLKIMYSSPIIPFTKAALL